MIEIRSDKYLVEYALYTLRLIQGMCTPLTSGDPFYNIQLIKRSAKEAEKYLDESLKRNIELEKRK